MASFVTKKRFIVIISLVASCILSPVMTQAQWSQYQGNAAHTGYVAETVTVEHLAKKWEKVLTYEGAPAIRGALAVSQQGVFASAHAGDGYYTYYDLVSLNRSSGSEQWRTPVHSYSGGNSVSAPSLGGSKVYVHSYGHSGISGGNQSQYPYLMGADAATGAQQFATTHSGQWNAGCRPTVLGDQVVALGGYYGGMDSYNATSGARGWYVSLPQQYDFIPAMDGQSVYIYYGQAGASPGPSVSTLYAIDRQTGAIQYTVQNPSDMSTTYSSISSVMLGGQNDAVVIGKTDYNGPKFLTSFDLTNHSVRWTRGLDPTNALALADGMIAVPTMNALKMINEATGTDLWTWATPAGARLTSNVVMTGNCIFVASADTLFGIDRTSGLLKYSEFLGSNSSGYVPSYNLAYYGGTVYVSGCSRIMSYAAVPEPSSLAALGLALGALGTIGLRRRR